MSCNSIEIIFLFSSAQEILLLLLVFLKILMWRECPVQQALCKCVFTSLQGSLVATTGEN